MLLSSSYSIHSQTFDDHCICFRPNYTCEIQHLLYGMSCERLAPLISESGIDLKTFLLLEESDMIKLGIDMPFERQRLTLGLRNFHAKGWNLNSVAGLYAQKLQNYRYVNLYLRLEMTTDFLCLECNGIYFANYAIFRGKTVLTIYL